MMGLFAEWIPGLCPLRLILLKRLSVAYRWNSSVLHLRFKSTCTINKILLLESMGYHKIRPPAVAFTNAIVLQRRS